MCACIKKVYACVEKVYTCVERVCYLWLIRTDGVCRWPHHVEIALAPFGP